MTHPIIDPQLLLPEAAVPRRDSLQAGTHFDGRVPMTGSPPALAPMDTEIDNARRPAVYSDLTVLQLRNACRTRNLKQGGKKAELVQRLQEDERNQGIRPVNSPMPFIAHSSQYIPSSNSGPHDRISNDASTQNCESEFDNSQPALSIDAQKVIEEAVAIEGFFQLGLEKPDCEVEGEDEEDERVDVEDLDNDIHALDNFRTHDSLQWVDKFILDTRRKGGHQTETSVLKLWKAWTASALNSGLIPDLIIDANHVIEYLKYAATRQLFNTQSEHIDTAGRLSAASLKKIMTMLGRVRRRQEDENAAISTDRPYSNSRTKDFYKAVMVQSQRLRLASESFDVTKGTILDSELRPDQFDEVTAAIFTKTAYLPSIIKSHFSWTWQCSTLNRSDEVVSLPMFCIQPYYLRLPDYNIGRNNGQTLPSHRQQFGVLSMYHETKTAQPGKTEPKYSFVLPHRNPLRCPLGALAIELHYMFDQEGLLTRIPSWDWENAATWKSVHVLFGKKVEDSLTGEGLGRIYSSFLENTSITSKKKTHLARRTMPTLLEEMGVPADQVDASGHWQGNTRREVYGSKILKLATVALAGFPVGEIYHVPWAQVDVPTSLQHLIFPFCEDVIARLRATGCTNQGTFNFLELLQNLRPFFWRAIAAIQDQFPRSMIIKRLNVLHDHAADAFLRQWPEVRQQEEAKKDETAILSQAFQELPTQNAFTTLSAQVQIIQSELAVIKRRTEPFSPTKAGQAFHQSSASSFQSSVPLEGFPGLPSVFPHPNAAPMMPTRVPAPNFSASSSGPPATPRRLAPSSTSALVSPMGILETPPPAESAHSTLSVVPGLLIPVQILGARRITYSVLRLAGPASPNQTLDMVTLHTPYNKILPHRAAFPHHTYPPFTNVNCTWQYAFQTVSKPSVLWDSYAPGNLGDYPTVIALWEAWDEGTYVINIGRKAPLRLIDQRWGSLRNEETNQGQLPSWRPRNNNMARKIWSNFFFFVTRIQELIKAGQSSADAVAYFENLRQNGNKSLSQLRNSLKKKRETKRARPDN